MTTTWFDLSVNEKIQLRHQLTQWLLKQRLSQVGYDKADFKRLSLKATKLRKQVKYRGIDLYNNHGIYSQLVTSMDDFALVVTDTFNEDYIEIMTKLVQPR